MRDMTPYDYRKAADDRHATAQRNLPGRLQHCLATRQRYNEASAFPAAAVAKHNEAA